MSDDSDGERGSTGRHEFIDQRVAATRTGLIVPDVRGQATTHGVEARKAEFDGLAGAIGLDIVFSDILRVRAVRPATFLGGGQVKDIAARVEADEVELLLVDAA